MAETNGEPHSQTLDPESNLLPPSKRKADPTSLEEGEREGERAKKHQKPEVESDAAHQTLDGASEDDGRQEAKKETADADEDRTATIVKGKGELTAVDKGKGIMVEEEEEEEGEDDDEDSNDSSDVDSGDEIGEEGDDDSDFVDDPLAEVDLENILPSRTRRREPPPPGAYFDPVQDEDDSDESE
ncbi:hypothetical protein B296_00028000 [Ensete ventricosum]|uniref:Histone chaperone domain-containing protein n=1 Tax=Ensete ventricosum TaxID=4639 RepID=A0A426Y0Z6_ENSVE|nr:hypothetical protein B296_00028000 [Ensete ventricosum]